MLLRAVFATMSKTAPSITALAVALGVSRQLLSRLRANCPALKGDGPYKLAAVRAWLDQHHPEHRDRAAVQAGSQGAPKLGSEPTGTSTERIAQSRARKLAADAQIAEIELSLRRRESWPAQIVRVRWAAFATSLHSRLDSIFGNELPARMGGAPTADQVAANRKALTALFIEFSDEKLLSAIMADQRKEENKKRRTA
jgi:hypothetical protein